MEPQGKPIRPVWLHEGFNISGFIGFRALEFRALGFRVTGLGPSRVPKEPNEKPLNPKRPKLLQNPTAGRGWITCKPVQRTRWADCDDCSSLRAVAGGL